MATEDQFYHHLGKVWVAGATSSSSGGGGSPASAMLVQPAGMQYETVAASQTAQVMGTTGATGNYLYGVLIVPASTSPGTVAVLDNAISFTVFTGGASSVATLHPFFVPLGVNSVSGAWKITTGASVSAVGIGIFT